MGLPTLPKIYNVYFVAIVATLGGMLYVFSLFLFSSFVLTDTTMSLCIRTYLGSV